MPKRLALAALLAAVPACVQAQTRSDPVGPARDNIDALIETHARANKVPSAFVHRVIKRESNYNPRARGGSALGLMQIKHATARGLGYDGGAAGLFDPEVNLRYGVAYLAGAYRAAKGDLDQAYRYYNRGYYYAAKQLGITTSVPDAEPAPTSASGFASLFQLRGAPAAPVQTASADTGALAYAAAPAGDSVAVPLPPQRPTAWAGLPAGPEAAAPIQVAAQPAAQSAALVPNAVPSPTSQAVAGVAAGVVAPLDVPLPPRRPSATRIAAGKRAAPPARDAAPEAVQAVATAGTP